MFWDKENCDENKSPEAGPGQSGDSRNLPGGKSFLFHRLNSENVTKYLGEKR